jgi:DNA-binding response OmpR family regulator
MTTRFEWERGPRHEACRGVRTNRGAPVPTGGYIVIAEPDELIRQLLERWLGEAGYEVMPLAENHERPMVKPRLVIADISEPGSVGNRIEALEAAYAAPILALSARFRRGLGGSSEPARRLRVAEVLPKPFTRQQLLRAVRETLKDT